MSTQSLGFGNSLAGGTTAYDDSASADLRSTTSGGQRSRGAQAPSLPPSFLHVSLYFEIVEEESFITLFGQDVDQAAVPRPRHFIGPDRQHEDVDTSSSALGVPALGVGAGPSRPPASDSSATGPNDVVGAVVLLVVHRANVHIVQHRADAASKGEMCWQAQVVQNLPNRPVRPAVVPTVHILDVGAGPQTLQWHVEHVDVRVGDRHALRDPHRTRVERDLLCPPTSWRARVA